MLNETNFIKLMKRCKITNEISSGELSTIFIKHAKKAKLNLLNFELFIGALSDISSKIFTLTDQISSKVLLIRKLLNYFKHFIFLNQTPKFEVKMQN